MSHLVLVPAQTERFMLLTLVLFSSCVPDADAERVMATPPARDEGRTLVSTVGLPSGSAIVRECYAKSQPTPSRNVSYGTSSSASSSSSSSKPKSTSATTGARAPTPAPSEPSVTRMSSGDADKGAVASGGSAREPAPPAPAAAPVAEVSAAPSVARADDVTGAASPGRNSGGGALGVLSGAGESAGASADSRAKQAPAKKDSTKTVATEAGEKKPQERKEEVGRSRAADEEAKRRIYTPEGELADADVPAEPDLDWGATVYLSNDDSMSLASAQRLLWAIQKRASVSPSQIRPHEFLNYFSFDAAPFVGDDVFSVGGSAELTDGDTLTMAFSVKGYVPERRPLDLTLVVDRSGSMSSEGRMEYLKRGFQKMTENLQKGDRIDLVLFDHEVCTPLEDYVVGRDDPSLWTDAVNALKPRGSTNIGIGLKEGYRIATARDDDRRNQRMMLLTDARVNTGDVNPDTVSEIGRAYDEHGIAFTGVGVGRDFNDTLLNKITEKGKGAYVYLGSEAVVDRIFGVGFNALVQNIAHDVHFSVDLPDSLAMERFYGEEASTVKADIQPINYYAGSGQLFLQDLKVRGRVVRKDPVTFAAEWRDPETGGTRNQTWTTTVGAMMDADQHNLRKARALMAWTDMITYRAMGAGSPCGDSFSAWKDRVAALGEDAEIAWLDGLTRPLCGESPAPPAPPKPAGVAYKVKVDSDMPIAEVGLTCGSVYQTDTLSGSDTVAAFTAAPGACTLTLQGTVPMSASVQVPVTGGDVRCMVRGGRLSCS